MGNKTFENVKVTFKGDDDVREFSRGFYDFYIKDGVITIICFASKESSEIVSATIFNPSEIQCIEVY